MDNTAPKDVPAVSHEVTTPPADKPAKLPKTNKAEPATGDLIAIHNISATGLHHAHELGGLPAPSLAVVHKDHGMNKFGEISLVAHHEMVNPRHTPVFNADVYSPRFPRAKYAPNKKPYEKMLQWLHPYVKRVGSQWSTTQSMDANMIDKVENYGAKDALFSDRDSQSALRLAFLEEKGHTVTIPTQPAKLQSNRPWLDTPSSHKFFAENGYKSSDDHEYRRAMTDAMVTGAAEYDKQIGTALGRPDYDAASRGLKNNFISDEGMLFPGFADQHARTHQEFVKNPVKIDSYAAYDQLEESIKPHSDEFDQWLQDKTAGVDGKRYIEKGSRKLPYTIENVLDHLTRTIRGGEGFDYGPASARAMGAHQFTDLNSMRNSGAHSLAHPKEMEKLKELSMQRMVDLAEKAGCTVNQFSGALGEFYKKKRSLQSALTREGADKVPTQVHKEMEQFAKDLIHMPSEYFEAKPQRIVGINEFKGAAIPHDASAKTIQILDHHGIKHIERYDRHNGEDRAKAIRKIAETQRLALCEIEAAFETLTKAEELMKAIPTAHLSSILKASDAANGPANVDHTPHLSAHPPSIEPEVKAYREKILQSPKPVGKVSKGKAGISDGITRKAIFQAPVHEGDEPTRFMVKPYHERVIKRVRNYMKHPIQGWAEMANQALYHAGGIGHLHQKVHVSEHDMGPKHEKEPALVVHLDKGYSTVGNGVLNRIDSGKVKNGEVRKIALMDFLTNNHDRHTGNLLFNTENGSPLAIDHSRSFQYVAPKGRTNDDRFGDYVENSAISNVESLRGEFGANHQARYDNALEKLRSYSAAFDWWGENSSNIKNEFTKHLEYLKDPEVKEHIKRNFDTRTKWLDERASFGLENFGEDWHRNDVPLYKPGETTAEEQRDPEFIAVHNGRIQAKRDAKKNANKAKLDKVKNHKRWLAAMPLFPRHLAEMPMEERSQHPDWKKYAQDYKPWLANRPEES